MIEIWKGLRLPGQLIALVLVPTAVFFFFKLLYFLLGKQHFFDKKCKDKKIDTNSGLCYTVTDKINGGLTMKTCKVHFVTIADLYSFVEAATKYPFDIVLKSGHYNVDGKSFMGMYCLDLMHDIELTAHTEQGEAFFKEIEKFIVQ